MQDDVYATFVKFEAFSKELAAKMLILENARNYSEPEPYINTYHSWEEDSSSQLEESLTRFIKMETSFENLVMQLGLVFSQLALQLSSSGEFDGKVLDSPRDKEIEREFKKKCEVVDEGGIEKEKEEGKCTLFDKEIEPIIEGVEVKIIRGKIMRIQYED